MRSCLSLVPTFHGLDEKQHQALTHVLRHRHVRKGEIVARQGEEVGGILVVARGKLKRVSRTPAGQQQILEVLYSGDFFGELALFHPVAHRADIAALADGEVCFLYRQDLYEVLLAHPEIGLRLLESVSLRLAESEGELAAHRLLPARERLLRSLRELLAGRVPPTVISLPFSRKDWAESLGVAPETLSRLLRQLEEEGLLHSLSRSSFKVETLPNSQYDLI